MPIQKVITGNDLLDKLSPIVPNPEYNPKTKAGRSVPQYLVDTKSPELGNDFMANTMRAADQLSFTGRELGFTNEQIQRDADLGISLSPYNTEEELAAARAKNQSALTKTGNALIQAGLGEIAVGILEGFGNIVDGVVNSFNRDAYNKNPWTSYWENVHNDIRDKFQIYQEHNDEGFHPTDWGWWMNGLVSTATTASLMVPAAGWMRAISYLGKVGQIGKLSQFASRALARTAKASKANNSFNALRNAASKANRIEKSINDLTNIAGTAVLSRMGENFMEGKQIYNDVYDNSKKNLEGMPDEEFQKFLTNHPEFINEDGTVWNKDDIAKEIARKSANTTFYRDFAMLLMDIPQFKALGKLWGRVGKRASTASERIAAENARRTLAGEPAEKLIKDNFHNRVKEDFKYALKNPKSSIHALELGEGFEEMYQGIQSEKGMETAERYFNPAMTPRSIMSYLADESIWTQGFWGTIGGIAFNAIGKGMQAGSRKIEGLRNKKHMSAEDYERWNRSQTKVGVEQINNIVSNTDNFINNMRQIEDGKNPFSVVKDPDTGQEIIVNGEMINEDIDETQKDFLREKAIKEFTDNTTMDAMDYGTYDLIKEVIGSKEFDQYLAKNGITMNASDTTLHQSVVDRMQEVADLYENEIKNVDGLADTTNPFITIAAARNIVRNKMKLQDHNDVLADIQDRINEASTNAEAESIYTEQKMYDTYKHNVNRLLTKRGRIEKQFNDGKISKSARDIQIATINKEIQTWNQWATENTQEGALDETRRAFEESIGEGKSQTEYMQGFNNFMSAYQKAVNRRQTNAVPVETVKDLIDQRVVEEGRKVGAISQIPTTAQEYQDLYNEFSVAMDEVERTRTADYINMVKEYLQNSKDLESAIKTIYAENTGNKKLDEALHYLRYRLEPTTNDARGIERITTNLALDDVINTARKEREEAQRARQEAQARGIATPDDDGNNAQQGNGTGSSSTGQGNGTANGTTDNNGANSGGTNIDQYYGKKHDYKPKVGDKIRVFNVDQNGNVSGDYWMTVQKVFDNGGIEVENGVQFSPSFIKRYNDGYVKSDSAHSIITEVAPVSVNPDAGTNTDRGTQPVEGEDETDAGFIDDDSDEYQHHKEEADAALDLEDESYDTPELRAELAARKYVMQLGFTNDARLKEIASALANNDNSKLAALLGEVRGFLIEQGFDPNVAKRMANKATVATVNLFGALNEKSGFAQLAHQLAIGFSRASAKKYSNTELIIGDKADEALNEVVDEFLEQYSKDSNNHKLPNGVTVINLQSLFDKILNDDAIDINTAVDIYNNIAYYISTHDGSKYKFTGFNTSSGLIMNGREFIQQLKENKEQILDSRNLMHLSPVEPQNRDKNYRSALIAAHNGEGKIVFEREFNQYGTLSNLVVSVRHKVKGKKNPVTTKIGILRALHVGTDGTTIEANSFYSGFSNTITNKDGIPYLNCDPLFWHLIDLDSSDAQALWDDLVNYYITVQDIVDARRAGRITSDEAKKQLNAAMSLEMAERISNNPLYMESISKKWWAPFERDRGVISNARQFASNIGAVLFYGKDNYIVDGANYGFNSLAFDRDTLAERYELWKYTVRDNYEHTLRLQEALEKGDTETARVKLNVSYNTIVNYVPKEEPKPNINELPLEHDPNAKNYTPLVIVKDGRLIGEDGHDYGLANRGVSDYSMGYIVYNRNNIPVVAYLTHADISNTDLGKAAKREFVAAVTNQMSNTSPDSHDSVFESIVRSLTNLFGSSNTNSLFKFGANTGGQFSVIYHEPSNSVTIQRRVGNNQYVNIITFHGTNNFNNVRTPGNTITIYDYNNPDPKARRDNAISFSSFKGNSRFTADQISKALNDVYTYLFSDILMNRSEAYFKKEGNMLENDGKFTITLGGKTFSANNYGQFMQDNAGFTTDIMPDENGSFVTRVLNENRLTIDTKVQQNSNISEDTNTVVTDALYSKEGDRYISKRKTVDTVDLLETAGVSQEQIDILTGKNSGLTIVSKRISVADERGDANMFYDKKKKQIAITPKGAKAMDDPNIGSTNAVRLVLHENIHRLFQAKSNYNINERNRIIDELKEVYDYVRKQLEDDHNYGKIGDKFYNDVISVLNKATSYGNDSTNMEEFLVECLTQAPFTEWLNNTQYPNDADISGIEQKKKSILQKIMDILLNLLGLKDTNIKNGSILAREYVILSKGLNSTISGNNGSSVPSVGKGKTDNRNPPSFNEPNTKTLADIEREVDNIRATFESRIQRSPNFATDHTYLLDGKSVDYSVTQKIHGKQDLGDWSIPSSTLGNTADAAARGYFDHNGVITDDTQIPNVDDRQRDDLINSMSKIEQHLDNRFGKGRYKVITKEFPIGGTIEVNGDIKTIAGTMDMLVLTDTGDIYIYDFKTKRIGNSDGNISSETLVGYKQQVNIYRQLIEENFPKLKGKVHTGNLIKFNVDYPAPDNNIKYRSNPNNESQLQISRDGGKTYENIQNAAIDYTAPTLPEIDFDNADTFIPVEQQDYGDRIGPMPDNTNPPVESDVTTASQVNAENENQISDEDDAYFPDNETDDDIWIDFAATDTIITDDNEDIYAVPVVDYIGNLSFGAKIVNNMDEFVNTFPAQYRADIKQLLAENELNFFCS